MKLSNYPILLVAGFILFSFGCKDDDDCTAGTGGDLTLLVSPQHHGMEIYGQGNYRDTVYIKFNTQEFPGASPSSYDLIAVGDSGEDHVHIHGLTCGNYYIYAVGLDTSLNERVFGGKPFSITETSGEIVVNIPVTE